MKNNFSPFAKWLFCCFTFIAILIAVRIIYSGNKIYLFLIWNLFLAWIPYILSLNFVNCIKQKKIVHALLFTSWLLFFPNALYIVTDIIHIKERTPVPVWFDSTLLFISSFAGLALAFASIKNVENLIQHYFHKKFINAVVVALLFVGSFGIYLGRFQRWDSWDILNNPLSLAADILHRFTSPFIHTKTWAVTFLLTALYAVCLFFIQSFPILQNHSKQKNV